MYDLSSGGTVSVSSSGNVPVVNGQDVSGTTSFSSNEIQVNVDGAKASQVTRLERRTTVQNCRSSSRRNTLDQALSNCAYLANQAANAARSGSSSRFAEYFGTTSSNVRQTVAARLDAVAQECSSTTGGATTYNCGDAYGYCSQNVLAYTLPSINSINNCDIYYTYLPAVAQRCHAQDQATTSLHEMTHAPGVYYPGTKDLGYGYQAATSLSTQQAVNNADSYALYANGMFHSSIAVARHQADLSSCLPWLLRYSLVFQNGQYAIRTYWICRMMSTYCNAAGLASKSGHYHLST